jgi:hypothetical protein
LSRALRVAESATATSEPTHDAAVATGSRQEVAATVAVTSASAVPPAPVPTTVDQAAVVEIPDDDDALPPGWGQWENWPAPAPEPATGVLVM